MCVRRRERERTSIQCSEQCEVNWKYWQLLEYTENYHKSTYQLIWGAQVCSWLVCFLGGQGWEWLLFCSGNRYCDVWLIPCRIQWSIASVLQSRQSRLRRRLHIGQSTQSRPRPAHTRHKAPEPFKQFYPLHRHWGSHKPLPQPYRRAQRSQLTRWVDKQKKRRWWWWFLFLLVVVVVVMMMLTSLNKKWAWHCTD